MSSHHIIRENQEPALIVEQLEDVDWNVFSQLLEWSPMIVVRDSVFTSLQDNNIKIDVVIGNEKQDIYQDHIEFIPAQNNFLDSAIEYLRNRNCNTAYLFTSEPNSCAVLDTMPDFRIIGISRGIRYYAISSGFEKWKPMGETFNVLGTQQDIEHTGLITDKQGEYKTVKNGFFKLTFNENYKVMCEPV